MIKHRIVRGAIAGSLTVVPLAGATLLEAAAPAGAVIRGITCTKITGKENLITYKLRITLGSCTGKTGGSGTIKGQTGMYGTFPPSSVVNWSNGKSTSFTASEFSGTGCPKGRTLFFDEIIPGAVSSDNTGSTTVGAAVSAEVCVNTTATPDVFKITEAPGLPWMFAA